MKTRRSRPPGSCPDWEEDIPAARAAEFDRLLGHVHQAIVTSASKEVITDADIQRWHGMLFAPFVPVPYYAGNVRQDDWRRPCLGIDVGVGDIAGCPFAQTPEMTRRLFLDADASLRQLEVSWPVLTPDSRAVRLSILIGLLIGTFIRIHPFINGNGRASRLWWRWLLFRFGVPSQVVTSPRPAPPYEELMAAAMAGDDRPLQRFVLRHLQSNAPRQS